MNTEPTNTPAPARPRRVAPPPPPAKDCKSAISAELDDQLDPLRVGLMLVRQKALNKLVVELKELLGRAADKAIARLHTDCMSPNVVDGLLNENFERLAAQVIWERIEQTVRTSMHND